MKKTLPSLNKKTNGFFKNFMRAVLVFLFFHISNGVNAQNLTSVTVSAPSASRTYGAGGTITYTVTVTRNNNGGGSATLSTSILPLGVTASFSPATVIYSGNTPTATSTLTITTTNTASAVTNSSFTVTAVATNSVNGTGNFTINRANLTITANNANKTYGSLQSSPVSSSTGFTATGLQNSQTIGSVTLTYGSGALATTANVGSTSTITPSAATGGTFTPTNYNITYTANSGTLTVTAAPLTITATNASKCFGTVYSSSSNFTSSGLVLGQTIGSVTLTSSGSAANAAAGSYTIVPSAATGGTFSASNYSITYANGTLTVNNNTWLGTTSSAWNNAANWSCGSVPSGTDYLIISSSLPNAPILNVDYTLGSGSTLILSGTGSLTIASQSNLTIAGTADFGGKPVTIKSDSNGTGAIGTITGSLSNANDVTVERYIPQGKRAFRFLTPGVTTTDYISGNWQESTYITGSTTGSNGFDVTVSGSPSMYTYNNTVASGTGWTAIPNTNATNLTAGFGYRILIRGDRTPSLLTNASAANMNTAITLSATGTLRTGQVVLNASSTPAINNTSNTTTNGFSLVGNPYVCAVDWHAVTRSGLLDTYYAWDANMGTSSQRGRYVAYSVATGFNSLGGSGSSQVGRYIQPGQAFFVRNTTLGTAGTLTFNESNKADTYTNVFRTQETQDVAFSKLGLLVYEPNELALGSSPIDGAVAFFGSDFTNAIDSGDVEKLESAGENLAWFNSNQKLAMATMASVSDNDELLLKSLRFAANKSYTFKFETSDFDASTTAFLVDQFLNTQTPINLNEDVFVNFDTTSDVLSYGENRFKIVFNVEALGNPDFESFVSLYPNPANGNLFYLHLPTWDDNTKVTLYNTLGQQIPVTVGDFDGMTRQYKVAEHLVSGVYYVKIAQNGKEATKKWILNN